MIPPKHPLSAQISRPRHTFAFGAKLGVMMSLLALSAAACDDMDELADESESDVHSAAVQGRPELAADVADADEPDDGGDAKPSLMGDVDSLQAVPADPEALTESVCCEIVFDSPFRVFVQLTNPGPTILAPCSDFFAGQSNLTYKVQHYYNSPTTFTGTTGPLPLGESRLIELTHSGALNAMSCQAFR